MFRKYSTVFNADAHDAGLSNCPTLLGPDAHDASLSHAAGPTYGLLMLMMLACQTLLGFYMGC